MASAVHDSSFSCHQQLTLLVCLTCIFIIITKLSNKFWLFVLELLYFWEFLLHNILVFFSWMDGHDESVFSLPLVCFGHYNVYVYTYIWLNTFKARFSLCYHCQLYVCSTFKNELPTVNSGGHLRCIFGFICFKVNRKIKYIILWVSAAVEIQNRNPSLTEFKVTSHFLC